MNVRILADLGNSRWKLALYRRQRIEDHWAGGYADPGALEQALRIAARENAAAIWLASVASMQSTAWFRGFCLGLLPRLELHVVETRAVGGGIVNGYRQPAQLGVDRWLAMIAARALFPDRSLCVVDAGTAITVDFVDRHGRHLGGLIHPGLSMARRLLLTNTSIPAEVGTAEVGDDSPLGLDTATAIANGSRYAAVGLINYLCVGNGAIFPDGSLQLVLGGGDARALIGLIPGSHCLVHDLVLRGLAVMAEQEGG